MVASNTLTILHFNDVYNAESREEEPCGGAARFVHLIKSFTHLNPLILFSGDIFSPSFLSTITKGEHMALILNEIGTHCAVFGNHDFDFGLEVLSQRVGETKFPWLMSNVIDNKTGRPLGDGKVTHVVDWNGKRIGLIGLVEEDWIETIITTIAFNELTFSNFVDVAQKLGSQLKKEGCDFVIALTHMRTRNDKKLAECSSHVDLILGGHDHVYEIHEINGIHVIKSGTDFRQFSKITLEFQETGKANVNIEEINVTKSVPEDESIKTLLAKYRGSADEKMKEVICKFSVPLEGRFSKIRFEETNLGNWLTDILLATLDADVAALNSGSFRSDQIHEAGNFTLGDLTRIVPTPTPTIKLRITGKVLYQFLENGVSKYPAFEGRFPQVAGLKFAFDPTEPPGKRVDPLLIKVRGEYLVMDRYYSFATKEYLHLGCDGYDMLPRTEVLISEELSPSLSLCVQNFLAAQSREKEESKLATSSSAELRTRFYYPSEKGDQETGLHIFAPVVEGRIIKLDPQLKKDFYREREQILSGK